MRQYRKELVEQNILEDVVCNMCGQKISKNTHGYLEDHMHFHKTWNYSSAFDGTEHAFDLCVHCYRKLIDSFSIKIHQ
jgi:hypothetical protein